MRKKNLNCIIIIFIAFLGINFSYPGHVNAGDADTATLRILATGDLHGQVTAYNCETHSEMTKKGFSRLATLIRRERKKVGADNTLLVDAGDFLYDYTSNYFYDHYSQITQPILKAMSALDYDYITLGNHEFDYPWEYLSRQLEISGFSDKTLVCNTVWHDSGKQVFSPSSIVTKTLTTADQKSVSVKIGIVGSTTNSISTRRGDYVNVIDAINNYNSIVAEANRLKSEEKVDLVIVILHGGIGTKNTDKSSDNLGYLLTKVTSVDALVTAHTHETFPDSDNPISSLSNADSKNGCINGKPVVATSSHAGALGTIDLTMQVTPDGSVVLSGGKSNIRYADQNVAEDSVTKALFSDYLKKLKAAADTSTYKIAKGITYNNYDSILQDSNLYQLFNNAKIAYGLTYISENLPKYKNTPIIACTRNLLDSNDPYVLMKDTLSVAKISKVLCESASPRPSGYIQMYEITGKQLREWLEYNASMYAVSGTRFKTILQKYVSCNKGVSTLLQENYIYNWSNQFVFDGISYTVDLTKKARYSSDGSLTSSSNKRITSLTYHGANVTDSRKFVLVEDSGMPNLSFLPSEGVNSIKNVKDYETGKNITLNYIKQLSQFGAIAIKADHNWSLKSSTNYTFLLGISNKIAGAVSKYSWSKGVVAKTTSYSFLKGKLPAVAQTINVVVSQGRTQLNNEPVPVVISASSKYGIKEIKYLEGKVNKSSDVGWKWAKAAKNSTFTAYKNGIYSIRVKDTKGNQSLAYVTVDRYAKNTLTNPILNRITNRNTKLTGTAVPYATIHVTIGAHSYSSKVAAGGKFSFNIKPPKAFTAISAYIEAAGIKSSTVTAAVRKTGPNAAELNPIRQGDTSVTGNASADTFVYALIWKNVYVGIGQTNAYRKSEYYKPTYKIIETKITMDPVTGDYEIPVPTIKSNMKVFVFSVDRFGITSKSTMQSSGK